MRWLDGITDSMDMNLDTPWEMVREWSFVCCSPQGHKESDVTWRLNNNSNILCAWNGVWLCWVFVAAWLFL